MTIDSNDPLERTLILAGRILVNEGQSDYTRGHISVRLPGQPDRFRMKSRQTGLEEMTPEDLITCTLDGEKIGGTAPRHNEVFIHSEILRARPDINCVIHTHPPHAVAFSALDRPLQPVGQPSSTFCGALPVYDDTYDLITDPARGRDLALRLGPHKAVLLKSHGIVAAGDSIEEAVYVAVVLEDACRLQLMVEAAGGAGALFPPGQVALLAERHRRSEAAHTTFAYLARRLPARSDS